VLKILWHVYWYPSSWKLIRRLSCIDARKSSYNHEGTVVESHFVYHLLKIDH